MKKTYLFLTILGFIIPGIFLAKVSIETGNILFYTKPMETINAMFANDIVTGFILDLLIVVTLFLVWSFREAKKYKMKNLWAIWIFTFLFGLASGLPLFLYFREDKMNKQKAA